MQRMGGVFSCRVARRVGTDLGGREQFAQAGDLQMTESKADNLLKCSGSDHRAARHIFFPIGPTRRAECDTVAGLAPTCSGAEEMRQ